MDPELSKRVEERFKGLPPVIQNAIVSADMAAHLRKLADTHKLHVDLWDKLSNQVTLTLLGFKEVADLPKNIIQILNMSEEDAFQLAGDINEQIFEPIREELERGLGAPAAKAVETTEMEAVRTQAIAAEKAAGATPPPPPLTKKAVRAPLSSVYVAAQPSHERKEIDGDPYREPVA